MNIIFFGTPKFALPALESIHLSQHKVLAVVTQPDKPKGRGLKALPSPVAVFAREHGIKLFQPGRLSDIKDEIFELKPDAGVVVAYGKLLPDWLLDIGLHGCINVHPSLLPKYRGAAPIESALLNNEMETGVSIMRLTEGMDEGPVYLQKEIDIEEADNASSLKEKLSLMAADLLLEVLDDIETGKAGLTGQYHARATYTQKISKEDLKIDWNDTAEKIFGKIRAFSVKPGAYCFFRGKRLKIITAKIPLNPPLQKGEKTSSLYQREVRRDFSAQITPGTIINLTKDSFFIAAGDGVIEIIEVQPEGKKPMSASEFIRGYKPQEGDLLK